MRRRSAYIWGCLLVLTFLLPSVGLGQNGKDKKGRREKPETKKVQTVSKKVHGQLEEAHLALAEGLVQPDLALGGGDSFFGLAIAPFQLPLE